MAITKFNLEEFQKRRRKEFNATPLAEKMRAKALRNALNNKNITLVPLDKRIPRHQVLKIKQVEKFAKTKNFWRVFYAFQDVPGVPKTRATANMCPVDYSNRFKTTALIVQAFFKKSVYTKGYVDFKSSIRVSPNLPDNFKSLEIDYSYRGLLEYIRRFEIIRNDPNYLPRNKKYLKSIILAEFIFGGLTSFSSAKPALLTACLDEPKTLFQDPDESSTKLLKKIYCEYTSYRSNFDLAESKGMALLATRLFNFSKVNKTDPSEFMEEFFKSLKDWISFPINYIFTEKMWIRFTDHLKKSGYDLKEEEIVVVEKKPVYKVTSPKERRKQLLIKQGKKKREEKKKINKPINIKKLTEFFQ